MKQNLIKIWHDPVISKVIGTIIFALMTWFWHKKILNALSNIFCFLRYKLVEPFPEGGWVYRNGKNKNIFYCTDCKSILQPQHYRDIPPLGKQDKIISYFCRKCKITVASDKDAYNIFAENIFPVKTFRD